jgi:hypothetical protein
MNSLPQYLLWGKRILGQILQRYLEQCPPDRLQEPEGGSGMTVGKNIVGDRLPTAIQILCGEAQSANSENIRKGKVSYTEVSFFLSQQKRSAN